MMADNTSFWRSGKHTGADRDQQKPAYPDSRGGPRVARKTEATARRSTACVSLLTRDGLKPLIEPFSASPRTFSAVLPPPGTGQGDNLPASSRACVAPQQAHVIRVEASKKVCPCSCSSISSSVHSNALANLVDRRCCPHDPLFLHSQFCASPCTHSSGHVSIETKHSNEVTLPDDLYLDYQVEQALFNDVFTLSDNRYPDYQVEQPLLIKDHVVLDYQYPSYGQVRQAFSHNKATIADNLWTDYQAEQVLCDVSEPAVVNVESMASFGRGSDEAGSKSSIDRYLQARRHGQYKISTSGLKGYYVGPNDPLDEFINPYAVF